MKFQQVVLIALSFLIVEIALADDINAITGDGRTVILHSNGKWEFAPKKSKADADTLVFTRPVSATREWQSKKKFVSIWYDPHAWRLSQSDNDSVEVQMIHESGDAYMMAVVERVEVPLQQLKELALQNALKAAPDAEIVAEKPVVINGAQGLLVDISGTTQGIKFRYHSFYYSNSAGSIQITTFTSRNLFNEYQGEFDKILSGIQINQ